MAKTGRRGVYTGRRHRTISRKDIREEVIREVLAMVREDRRDGGRGWVVLDADEIEAKLQAMLKE